MSIHQVLKEIEGLDATYQDGPDISHEIKGLIDSPIWNELKFLINDLVPKMTSIRLGGKYTFYSKKRGTIKAQVTKENGKSWIMYELSNSASPGARWTIYKTFCTEENVTRINSTGEIPSDIVRK